MKKIISFVLLFLGGIINTSTAGDWEGSKLTECDIVHSANGSFSCNDSGGKIELKGGNYVQFVGKVMCDSEGLPMRALRCNVETFNDYWKVEATKWHRGTLHNNPRDPNALYNLYGEGGGVVATNVSYDGSSAYGAKNGTVKAVCKEKYTTNGSSCVSISSMAKCAVKNNKHPGIDCNTSGGKNCLQAGADAFLYCYSEYYYSIHKIHDFENSCLPTVNIVTIAEKPGSYFTCTSGGVWQETKFNRCKSGDDFPEGCNDRPGCEDVANSPASSQVQTNATSVAQVWTSVSEETFCMVSRCKSGYTKQGDKCLSQDQVKQVKKQAADQKSCEESFGQWKNKRCQCDASKNLVESNGVCDCKDGYEKNKSEKKCTLIDAESKKNACIGSFGNWIKDKCECDISKGLVQQENKTYQCQCKDPEKYEFNREAGECRMTDAAQRQANCEKANRAQWIDGKCVCESGYEWNGSACNFSADYIRCDGVPDATWNKTEDKCICTNEDKELKDWKCVDSQETIAKGVINTSFPKFESLVSGLEVNKWKSADGTFNFARLASDSIAGALLGTAGGLITSRVVKKNQVKKGFENVRCVVGNQVVAEYGDEFTVGAQ